MADKVAFLLADSELRHRMGIAGRDLMVMNIPIGGWYRRWMNFMKKSLFKLVMVEPLGKGGWAQYSYCLLSNLMDYLDEVVLFYSGVDTLEKQRTSF